MAIEKDYHRRQAATLIRLAQTTRDPDTAAALMRLAAEHVQRAEAQNGNEPGSDTEQHLATDNELVRNVLLALLASLAKVEAQKISERTKAGMARAKAKGIKIGRPKLDIELRQKIAQRAAKGETAYAIAKALGIDRHTASRYAG